MPLLRAFIFFAGLTLTVSACGGGGGSSPAGAGAAPTPCPAGFTGTAPNCTQVSASGTLAIGTSPSAASLPSVAGYSAGVLLPSASGATTASVTTSTQPPSGVVALSSMVRKPQTVNTPLLYFTLVANATVTLNGIPGFTVTLPPGASANQSFFIALFQAPAGWQTIAGPGTVNGQTVTFAAASGSIGLTANQPLYFAFYAGGVVPTPTPSPSTPPTPTPAPTATPVPTATPTPSSASSALVYVTDSSDILPRIQRFAMQNGVFQAPAVQGGHEGGILFSAAVAPDGTFYTGYNTSVAAYTRDLTFLRTLAPNSSSPYLAADGGGNVYASTSTGINVYPPNATDTTAPMRVMNVPKSVITVDAHGQVITVSSSAIAVYPAKSSGAVAPTRTITPAPGITFSGGGLSTDVAGNIYVSGTVSGQSAILVYAPTAQGAAAPSRTISGPTANVGTPLVAVDAAGYIYVCCSQGLQSYTPFAVGDAAPAGPAASLLSGSHTNFTGIAVNPNAVTAAGPP